MKTVSCLNCGAKLSGRFCSECGQEDKPIKESFWALFSHFIGGLFNYENAIISTLGRLFLQPGRLSQDYIKGQRVRYIHPVRLYLFVSALSFLMLNYIIRPLEKPLLAQIEQEQIEQEQNENNLMLNYVIRPLEKPLLAQIEQGNESLLEFDEKQMFGSPLEEVPTDEESSTIRLSFGDNEIQVDSYEDFLAQQDSLPEEEKASIIAHIFLQQYFKVSETYLDEEGMAEVLFDHALSIIPQLLFVLLPLFAFLNRVVFFRSSELWYMDHAVFVLHMTTSFFIALWFIWWADYLVLAQGWAILDWFSYSLEFLWIGFYVVSFKRFYDLSWVRSILLLMWTGMWQIILLFIGFLVVLGVSFLSI